MTREEVKAQLAKCPLEWQKDIQGRLFSPVVQLEREVRITFVLTEGDVYVKADYGGVHRVGEFLGVEGSEEELKIIAEAQRLHIACRLLGIND